MRKVITTTYRYPDLDGYGCAVAYAEFLRAQGKNAEAQISGEPLLEVRWLLEACDIERAVEPGNTEDAQVILLDASDTDSLPDPFVPEQVIEIIDHRILTELEGFPYTESQIEKVGAAATLVAERFKEASITPSKESALLLYGGILSNTQNFTGIVTPRDWEMGKWLKKISGASDTFARDMFTAKSDLGGAKLKDAIWGDFKMIPIEGVEFGIAQLEIFGVEDLLETRQEEIESLLSELKQEKNLEHIFLNMKNLETGTSKILCIDDATRDLLKNIPGVSWNGLLGSSLKYTLRKQLAAAIDELLSKE